MTEEKTLPPIVKYSDEISLFIEGTYSCMDGIWYNNPLLFQKMGEGLWREWLFEKLPKGVQKDLLPLASFSPSYNQAIEKAIEIVKSYSRESWKLTEPMNHFLTPFDYIISKLQALKK